MLAAFEVLRDGFEGKAPLQRTEEIEYIHSLLNAALMKYGLRVERGYIPPAFIQNSPN